MQKTINFKGQEIILNILKVLLDIKGVFCYNNSSQFMRVKFNGRISAFQADRVGSIPITRSIFLHMRL